ncbi:MAG: hypothetical protein L3J35_04265 [Bacteroidales bacterium]|nr:hypothetical protein [Bacteroidales bacterium]
MAVRSIVLLFGLLLLFFSCKNETEKTELARVYDKYLYLEDTEGLIPNYVSKEDSILIIRNKIDLWVRKQTILRRAELNLTEEQKNIDDIVEDYRASLLIEKYKQDYIKQELDTTITYAEIEKYYNDYPESFSLNEEVVKALFFKFKITNENLTIFKRAYYENNEDEMTAIAKENATKFDNFDNKWVEVSSVLNLLPNDINNIADFLSISKKLQTRDNAFLYYVIFKEYKLKGDLMPIELTTERIKTILLNKRKTNIINQLEKQIYQTDTKNGNIKIFIE